MAEPQTSELKRRDFLYVSTTTAAMVAGAFATCHAKGKHLLSRFGQIESELRLLGIRCIPGPSLRKL